MGDLPVGSICRGRALRFRLRAKRWARHSAGVIAPDDDAAAAYARATYDEERWIEMTIVPRDAMTTLWAPGEEGE